MNDPEGTRGYLDQIGRWAERFHRPPHEWLTLTYEEQALDLLVMEVREEDDQAFAIRNRENTSVTYLLTRP